MTLHIDPETWRWVETLIEHLEVRRQLRAGSTESPPDPISTDGLIELQEALGITREDAEILLLALAPVARPRIGWLYREHQPGVDAPFPGIALICELLGLESDRIARYRNRLAVGAPLLSRSMVESDHKRPYAPIVPTPRALQRILGLRQVGTEIEGAILIEGSAGASGDALDRLVCPSELRWQLEEVACWSSCDDQLARWGVPVEHGPIVLFTGRSGTGKTMAACALADRAGLPLYRVDMGLLVSKYIGDTPKNVNRLFQHARRTEAVLLFDEAEGLFGRRGAVKEARDRYANMEVGHLLARMERHPGICLLTTNLRDQIDPAFIRRIDVVVEFGLPTEAEREQLWRLYLGHLPNSFGGDEDLGHRPIEDPEALYARLATVDRLSGAQIANACRYVARHFALGLGSEGPSTGGDEAAFLHGIARGLWNELKKIEGGAIESSLGFLQPHLVPGPRPSLWPPRERRAS